MAHEPFQQSEDHIRPGAIRSLQAKARDNPESHARNAPSITSSLNSFRESDVTSNIGDLSTAPNDAIMDWMHASLEELVKLIERVEPDMRGSVLLLDDDGVTLRHGAAPNLPEAYWRLIDGERIGPAAGSCGTAAYRGERVIVTDIATDPLWANYKDLAAPFDLAACWSTPIRDSSKRVIGTFAMYYAEPREPTPGDIDLTETATLLAANIITRARAATALRARTESAEQLATALRQREEELQSSQGRLRAALDASETSTWQWDMTTNVVDSDQGLFELFGVDPAQATGSFDVFVSRIHSEDRERVITAARRCAAEGVELDEEFRIVRPDGSMRWAIDRGKVVFGDDGKPRLLVGACVDITERHLREEQFRALEVRAREEIAAARHEAERANKAKSEFLAAMSHDLRTPLNSITGYVGLVADELYGPVTDQQRNAMKRVRRASDHLLSLINDILSFAKIEAGRVELQMADIRVNELVDGAATMIEPQAAKKGLSVGSSRGADDVRVFADRERVTQILTNLLTNAVKFTAEGSVGVEWDADDNTVQISVCDTGRGIPPDKLEAVFESFVQAGRSAEEQQQGVGLGLAISRQLARAMGGDLTVESAVSKGSTFTLSLPRGPGKGATPTDQ